MATQDVDGSPVPKDASDERASCLACNKIIMDGSESSVQCIKCDNWCHVSCSMAKEIFDMLAKVDDSKKKNKLVKYGVVAFVCELCCTSFKSGNINPPSPTSLSKTVTDSSSTVIANSSAATVGTSSTATPLDSGDSIKTTIESNQAPAEKATMPKQVICYHYRNGKCRHDKSGKKFVNGKQCDFLHPQKCSRFCRFGREKPNGCDGSCNLFHPKLCWSFVEENVCYSENCTLVHPKGLQKSFQDPQSQYARNKSYRRRVNPYYNNVTKQEDPPFHKGYLQQPQPLPRSQSQGFVYNQKDFPSLPSTYDDKISGLAAAVQKIQSCLEYLMGCKNAAQQPISYSQNVTENNPQEVASQPQAVYSTMSSQPNQQFPRVHFDNMLPRSQVSKN